MRDTNTVMGRLSQGIGRNVTDDTSLGKRRDSPRPYLSRMVLAKRAMLKFPGGGESSSRGTGGLTARTGGTVARKDEPRALRGDLSHRRRSNPSLIPPMTNGNLKLTGSIDQSKKNPGIS